jgi:hypothetical protein
MVLRNKAKYRYRIQLWGTAIEPYANGCMKERSKSGIKNWRES